MRLSLKTLQAINLLKMQKTILFLALTVNTHLLIQRQTSALIAVKIYSSKQNIEPAMTAAVIMIMNFQTVRFVDEYKHLIHPQTFKAKTP